MGVIAVDSPERAGRMSVLEGALVFHSMTIRDHGARVLPSPANLKHSPRGPIFHEASMVKSKGQTAGHSPILTPIGDRNKKGMPRDGWSSGCKCGWKSDELFRRSADAEAKYINHRDTSPPICACCGKVVSIERLKKYRSSVCVECSYKRVRSWAINNSGRYESCRRNHYYKKKYGITVSDYEAMLDEQGGVCAICGTGEAGDSRGFRLYVDHDHSSGVVRGLLCFSCNGGIGQLKDSVELLKKAIEYLERRNGALVLPAVAAGGGE